MAYILAEGFDTYGSNLNNALIGRWASFNGCDLNNTEQRTGLRCLEIPRFQENARVSFGSQNTTAIMGYAGKISTLPSSVDEVGWNFRDQDNNIQASMIFTPNGGIRLYRGGTGGTQLAQSSDGIISADTYFFLETKVTVDNTAGAIEVRVNGVTVLNISGVDTQESGNPESSSIMWFNSTGSFCTYYVDDIYILNDQGAQLNDFIGDHSVLEDVPDEDGADVDWAPNSTGADLYEMVDDIPQDGDTTYIEADAVDERAAFRFPDIDPAYTGVSVVELAYVGRKTSAGDGSVKMVAGSNGTEEDGDTNALTQTYTLYQSGFELDPDTSLPWSVAAANAVEAILERTL